MPPRRDVQSLLMEVLATMNRLPGRVESLVSREVRTSLMLVSEDERPSLPVDMPGQEVVLAALVEGRVQVQQVPLAEHHFYGPIHRAVYAAIVGAAPQGSQLSIGSIEAALARQGLLGRNVEFVLEGIKFAPCYSSMEIVQYFVPRLVAFANSRLLLGTMHQLMAQLRAGAITVKDACMTLQATSESIVGGAIEPVADGRSKHGSH